MLSFNYKINIIECIIGCFIQINICFSYQSDKYLGIYHHDFNSFTI